MKNKNKPILKVNFTIGFGNNIFQYVFARLLAEHHGMLLSHPKIENLGIKNNQFAFNKKYKTIKLNQRLYKTGAYKKYFKKKYSNFNIDLYGYFEDFTIYKNHLKKIKKWLAFSKIKKNKKDLAIHLRLQNRLIQQNHFLNLIEPKAYSNIIKKFKFKQLHIITDIEKWQKFSAYDIKKIQLDVKSGPNPGPKWVSTEDSLDYINLLIKELSKFNPIVHCGNTNTMFRSGGLRGNFMIAFNKLRSFDQLILHNSTFSWWAAVLGEASKVAIFSIWKYGREKDQPNLSNTTYKGWFKFGNIKDLYINKKKFEKYKTSSWKERKLKARIQNYIIRFIRLFTFHNKFDFNNYNK